MESQIVEVDNPEGFQLYLYKMEIMGGAVNVEYWFQERMVIHPKSSVTNVTNGDTCTVSVLNLITA